MATWNTGKKNGNWRGGRSLASNGYILIRVTKNHHLADIRGYAYEHRLVAEKKIGRRLRTGEIVHHKNGVKHDNRPVNLEVFGSSADHRVHHRTSGCVLRLPGQKNPMIACYCGCGQVFRQFDKFGR